MAKKSEHETGAPRGTGNEPKRKRADNLKKPEVLQAKGPITPFRELLRCHEAVNRAVEKIGSMILLEGAFSHEA